MSAAAERFGLPVLFLGVFALFGLLEPDTFLSTVNVRNVLGNESVLALVALASILPLIAGQLDLSLGATLGITAVLTGWLTTKHGVPLGLAAPAAVGAGALVGLVNGLLVTRAGVNALITTLGMATILDGLSFRITGGLSIVNDLPAALLDFGAGETLGLPNTTVVLIVVALGLAYALGATPLGRHLYLVGANREAARLVGLRPDRLVVASFVAAGALSGLAGVLSVAYNGNANPQLGTAYLLPALAAAFLGATSIRPGRFNVAGTVVAIFFLAFTVNGLNLLGVSTDLESIFNGTALIVAVSVSTLVARRRGRV